MDYRIETAHAAAEYLNEVRTKPKFKLLVVHDHTLAFQQDADPAIAEAPPLAGDFPHGLAELGTIRRAFAPDRLRIDTDKLAGPALRDIVIPHCP